MLFYVLVFGLLAVFVLVLGVMRMRGQRSGYRSSGGSQSSDPTERQHASGDPHASSHHPHTTEAARKARKTKRAESRRDRRKRR